MMSEYETLEISRDGPVMTIALNRPEKMNTFNVTLRREIARAAIEADLDKTTRAVILTGNGRAFSAGADLSDGDGMADGKAVESDLNFEYKPGVLAIHNSSKPWIAVINGPCAGIAYSYAMACDLACMGESSYLYQPFSAIGLVPDGGATWLIPRLVGTKRAYELMALGEKLSADKAVAMGMVNRVFPDENLRAHGLAYAQEVAARSPLALSYTKTAVNFGQTHNLDETISKEASLQAICIDSEDAKNAVISFFNKQKPVWKGQ